MIGNNRESRGKCSQKRESSLGCEEQNKLFRVGRTLARPGSHTGFRQAALITGKRGESYTHDTKAWVEFEGHRLVT